MTDVLLTKAYGAKDAGAIMTEVPVNEANAIEALGLGKKIGVVGHVGPEIILPEKTDAKGKGEKAAAE